MSSDLSDRAAEVVGDARWHLHRFVPQGPRFQFVRLERTDHRAATFLDDKFLAPDLPRATIDVAAITAAVAGQNVTSLPAGFVFHSSFAMSTLAIRLFDVPGAAMGLKEPVILNDLAWVARRSGDREVRPLLRLALLLLGRALSAGEIVIVKPSNVANRLIPEILGICQGTPSLLMTSGLRDYLLSIVRGGLHGRIEARRLFALLRRDAFLDAGFADEDLFQQTDLQIAAMAWLSHRKQFAALATSMPDRIRSLDTETFQRRREETIGAIGRWLRVPLDIAAIMAGGLLSEHAKQLGQRYDPNARANENAALLAAHGAEIAMVESWASRVAEHVGLPLTVRSPLIGIPS